MSGRAAREQQRMSFFERGAVVWAEWMRAAEPYFWLLVRVALGSTFASTGLGKLENLGRTIAFFRDLGIPAPELQAPFIGGLEVVGGACVALGLLTRLVALPLAATMLVAIATALWPDVHGLVDLLTLDETLYLFLFGALATRGAGPLSADAWLMARGPFAARRSSRAPVRHFGSAREHSAQEQPTSHETKARL